MKLTKRNGAAGVKVNSLGNDEKTLIGNRAAETEVDKMTGFLI
ncbi:hypothetical protein QYG89_13430 [Bacillus sp. B190/17]|uniref:Uncharacterized protein n=1 Tax=Bacillus lumedeiriae TaxID=3058829 RepID=A0ABW8IAX0_9BACI